MEAPKKIYLQEPTKVRTQKMYDNDIEYIRKDAFIEKALKWINEHTSLSEKLVIENFVNYMKGE